MSRKQQKRRIFAANKSLAPQNQLDKSTVPEGAVMADTAKQVANNSRSAPVLYYVDKPFKCINCDKEQVWTASQQKWYYEVAKGSLYATAIRCRACRRIHSEEHSGQGDPNRIKHEGDLIRQVQSELAQTMSEAGFLLISKSKLRAKGSIELNYSRDDLELSCRYDRPEATLVAESIDREANVCVIARVSMNAPRSTSQILRRIQNFADAVRHYVEKLPRTGRR